MDLIIEGDDVMNKVVDLETSINSLSEKKEVQSITSTNAIEYEPTFLFGTSMRATNELTFNEDGTYKYYVVIAPDIIYFQDRKDDGKFNIDKESKAGFERYKFCDYLFHGTTLQTKILYYLCVAIKQKKH